MPKRLMVTIGLAAMAAMILFGGCAGQQKTAMIETEEMIPAYPDDWGDPIPAVQSRAVLEGIEPSANLDALVKEVFDQTLEQVDREQLFEEMISVTLIDMSDPAAPRLGHLRGDTPWYPASIVKTALMAYAYREVVAGRVSYDDEFHEQMTKMIRPSSNVASQYVMDRMTATSPSLQMLGEADLAAMWEARLAPTRWYADMGLDGLYVPQKTWDELPGGSELQLLGKPTDYHFEHSNKMTTNDTARLMYLIYRHQIASWPACEVMLRLLEREPREFNPATGTWFIIRHGIPADARIWSKDGATGLEWHDSAVIRLADGREYVLVVYTHFRDETTTFITRYTMNILERLGE